MNDVRDLQTSVNYREIHLNTRGISPRQGSEILVKGSIANMLSGPVKQEPITNNKNEDVPFVDDTDVDTVTLSTGNTSPQQIDIDNQLKITENDTEISLTNKLQLVQKELDSIKLQKQMAADNAEQYQLLQQKFSSMRTLSK